MPEFRGREISIAFDLCGCPNRCRHCWLGKASRKTIPLDEAERVFREARQRVRDGAFLPWLENVRHFGGHVREPHYCPEYKALREKELELNAGTDYASDYELLSVWRLARDPEYGKWAREIGVRRCQIALFGLGEVNDWFCRRKGAHADILAATSRLLENGIAPRWQVFLNRKGLPDLEGILHLAESLRLRERCEAIGSPFQLFLNDWTPVGEARRHAHLRIALEEAARIPQEMILATEEFTGKPFVCTPEAEWITGMLQAEDRPIGVEEPPSHWLFLLPDGSVFPNVGSLEPWWRLGDFRREGLSAALAAFHADAVPALRAARSLTVHEAARRYGDPRGQRIYLSESDLRQLWLEKRCEADTRPRPVGAPWRSA